MFPSKSRCNDLLLHELERYKIVSQCGKESNVLYADFRYDEICMSLDRLYAKGLTLKKLFRFQNCVHHVVYAWNTEYNTLRQNVNRLFNVFPLIIVIAMKKRDVIAALDLAKKYKLRISLRSGSHCFENFSIDGEIVIDQSHRKKYRLSNNKNAITIQPGVLLGPITDFLSKYERMIVIGSCPNNAAVGFSLGGGIGTFTRIHGVSCDNILSAKILLANGKIVKADKKTNSDLYWALRGAGNGNYGIVMSLKIRTHKINKIYTFRIEYEFDDLENILPVWMDWIKTTPIIISSDFFCPANKGHPIIAGVYLGDRQTLEKLLEPVLAIPHIKVTIEYKTYLDYIKTAAGRGRWLPFFKFKNSFVNETFPPAALEIIKRYMSEDDPTSYFVIDNLGGANDTVAPDATAFVHRNLLGWFHLNAQWSNQELQSVRTTWANKFYEELLPYLSPQVYQNAPDILIAHPLKRYYASNLKRLREVKREYDPNNLFHFPQSIPE